MANCKKIKVLYKAPGCTPEIRVVDNTLESLQALVEGPIEAVDSFTDPITLVCNEEGNLRPMELNVEECYDGDPIGVLVGPVFICGTDDDEFCDIPEELISIYTYMLAHEKYEIGRLTGGKN